VITLSLSRPNITELAIERVAEVLRSGKLVYGEQARAFESELASFVGTNEAVVVSSGTAALYLAILGLELGAGDAVVVPGFTFPATINAVLMAGCLPLIVDVDSRSYCLQPEAVEAAIDAYSGSERLRAILLVHEFGAPCDLLRFRELAQARQMVLIEDAACALGATTALGNVGRGSHAACFSFHPRKLLTTGEGGLITTDDANLAERLRRWRNHGIAVTAQGVDFVEPALNFRLTDFQAALGRVQLPELPSWIEQRRSLAKAYLGALAGLEADGAISLPARISGQTWQTFMIVLNDRFDRQFIIQTLRSKGIETNVGAQALTEMTAYAPFARSPLPNSRRLFLKGLALPMFEQMSIEDVHRVAETLRGVLKNGR